VIKLLINDEDGFTKGDRNFALSLMLGIAYAANVGGIGTIIGTPPNTVMVGFVENEYNIQISFLTWMLIGVPFSGIMLGFIYLVLVKLVYPNGLGELETAKKVIDQEIEILLFGGGLALASALSEGGVIKFIGEVVAGKSTLSISLVVLLLMTIMLFMTELMSNVALVAVFAPVVAGVAIGLDQELLLLLIPVTMASSCAFMLPMATPPNAIVFASGHIKVEQMVRAGFILNIGSILLLWIFAEFVIPVVF